MSNVFIFALNLKNKIMKVVKTTKDKTSLKEKALNEIQSAFEAIKKGVFLF